MTRTLSATLAALSLLAAGPALASSQQDKMTACNKKAEGMKGDERNAFMSKCLSADSKADTKAKADATVTPQQQKMKDCNKKAEGMKGDERNAFMSKCLSGDAKK
jgi:hypothetical protein